MLGWIHCFVAHILESPQSYVEIGGLVVDESARGIVTLDRRLGADLANLLEKSGPIEMADCDVLPLLFACPSAVMREGRVNIGMGEVASPWSGAVAEGEISAGA